MKDDIKMDERIEFRSNKEINIAMNYIVAIEEGKYESVSHLIRCLILKEYNRIKNGKENFKW